jgi:hypothetical protein
MTPEERAQKTVEALVSANEDCFDRYAKMFFEKDAMAWIVADIQAAIVEERERCAKIAESFIPSGFTGDGKAGDTYAVARDDRARTIATAIRKEPRS